MKIAYLYTVVQYNKESLGVRKKVDSQVNELKRSGIDTDLKICVIASKIKRALPFQTSGSNLYSMRDELIEYDGLYIRYFSIDYQLLRTLRWLKKHKNNYKVVLEIPTFPYEEELKNRNIVVQFRDRFYRKFLKGKIDRIVTFSDDAEIYGIKTIVTCNGVDFNSIKKHHREKTSDKRLDLCVVASFQYWHGVDRLIKGLIDYYNNVFNCGKETVYTDGIFVHMVGNGTEEMMDQLHVLANNSVVANKIRFYGYKDGAELDEIYDKCDLAIASLGLHRLNIVGASTLKSREYLARGIPFVYSSLIFEFQKDPVDFALQVSTDEKNIDIQDVIEFYQKVIEKYGENISDVIRTYGLNHVSLSKTMKTIEEYYLGN